VWRYKKWRGIKHVFFRDGLPSESKASGKWLPEKAGKVEYSTEREVGKYSQTKEGTDKDNSQQQTNYLNI